MYTSKKLADIVLEGQFPVSATDAKRCLAQVESSTQQFGARPENVYIESNISEVQVWRLLDWWRAAASSAKKQSINAGWVQIVHQNVRDCARILWKESILHAAARPKNNTDDVQKRLEKVKRVDQLQNFPTKDIDAKLEQDTRTLVLEKNELKKKTDRTLALLTIPSPLEVEAKARNTVLARSNPFLEDIFVWVANQLLGLSPVDSKPLQSLLKDLCLFTRKNLFTRSFRADCIKKGTILFPALVQNIRERSSIVGQMTICSFPEMLTAKIPMPLTCWLATFLEWDETPTCKQIPTTK